MGDARIIAAVALLFLSACAPSNPDTSAKDRWISCVWPVDGKRYRLNASKAKKTFSIPGPSYVTFAMPGGRKWEMTERDAKTFCKRGTA